MSKKSESEEIDALYAAAKRRGWSLDRIALAAGVTDSRVGQRINRYEAKHGKIPYARQPGHCGPRYPWKCSYCGKVHWTSESRATSSPYTTRYCNQICAQLGRSKITKAILEEAITMRWQGRPWFSVARKFQFTLQGIQSALWKYLYVSDSLNMEIVRSIWADGRWTWLERTTGLVCTEFGARVDKPRYAGDRRNAWGEVVVRRRRQASNQPKGQF